MLLKIGYFKERFVPLFLLPLNLELLRATLTAAQKTVINARWPMYAEVIHEKSRTDLIRGYS